MDEIRPGPELGGVVLLPRQDRTLFAPSLTAARTRISTLLKPCQPVLETSACRHTLPERLALQFLPLLGRLSATTPRIEDIHVADLEKE
jgi:hypothetical protein